LKIGVEIEEELGSRFQNFPAFSVETFQALIHISISIFAL